MSGLLPNLNEKLTSLLWNRLLNSLPFDSISKDWFKEEFNNSIQSLCSKDINPLTFEEVKNWFDRKVAKEHPKFPDILYGGEHSHECYGSFYYCYQVYEVNYYRSFYIVHDGFRYSLNSSGEPRKFSELLRRDNAHYSLCELTGLTPLELFCQMKGYVNE